MAEHVDVAQHVHVAKHGLAEPVLHLEHGAAHLGREQPVESRAQRRNRREDDARARDVRHALELAAVVVLRLGVNPREVLDVPRHVDGAVDDGAVGDAPGERDRDFPQAGQRAERVCVQVVGAARERALHGRAWRLERLVGVVLDEARKLAGLRVLDAVRGALVLLGHGGARGEKRRSHREEWEAAAQGEVAVNHAPVGVVVVDINVLPATVDLPKLLAVGVEPRLSGAKVFEAHRISRDVGVVPRGVTKCHELIGDWPPRVDDRGENFRRRRRVRVEQRLGGRVRRRPLVSPTTRAGSSSGSLTSSGASWCRASIGRRGGGYRPATAPVAGVLDRSQLRRERCLVAFQDAVNESLPFALAQPTTLLQVLAQALGRQRVALDRNGRAHPAEARLTAR